MNYAQSQIFAALRRTPTSIQLESGYPAAARFKNLNLVEIPEVLERKGFTVAAALMRRWFVGQAFAMPPEWKDPERSGFDHRTLVQPYVDTSIVKMQWVLKHSRVGPKYHEVRNAVLSRSPTPSRSASQEELFKKLKKAWKFTNWPMRFGGVLMTPTDLQQTARLNSRQVSANALDKLADPHGTRLSARC